jgi:accessory gene regulator protein AgrB
VSLLALKPGVSEIQTTSFNIWVNLPGINNNINLFIYLPTYSAAQNSIIKQERSKRQAKAHTQRHGLSFRQ